MTQASERTRERVTGLQRELHLPGLTATGICAMLGASVYVVPFMIQRNVPGIGSWVLPAFLFAAVPALLAALAYAILASAMPRAGGSYLYASRGLHPYLGFVASFSQWFGLSIVIGVIAYIIVPFLRDIALALDWQDRPPCSKPARSGSAWPCLWCGCSSASTSSAAAPMNAPCYRSWS